MSDLYDALDELNIRQTISNLSPLKQRICLALVNGDNFNQIGKREGIKTNKIYKLREEMQEDLMWLKHECGWHDEMTFEDELFEKVIPEVKQMNLSRFCDLYLTDYSDFIFGHVKAWEKGYPITDRIIIVISIIVRELFVRSKPVVIDYHYDNRKSLVDLIHRFKIIVKSSPIIHDRLDVLHTDADLGIRLRDGSQVRAIWTNGKQPSTAGTLSIFDTDKSGNAELTPKITYL